MLFHKNPKNILVVGLASGITAREFIHYPISNLDVIDINKHVKARLNDSGIFIQFMHSYQMDWPTFSLVGRTFARVFPNSILMRTNPLSFGPDFLLVGFKGNKNIDARIMEQRISYSSHSKNIALKDYRVLYPLIVDEDLKTLFGEGPINTDALPLLEFSAPKLLHTEDNDIVKNLKNNSSPTGKITNIMREAIRDVDFQIAYTEFAVSIIKPEMIFENIIDLSRASKVQKDRYYKIIKQFCENNMISSFSFIGMLN